MPNIKNTAKKLGLQNVYHSLNKISYHFAAAFSHERIELDAAEARKTLSNFSPKPGGSSFARNNLIEPFEYDLQIIIPAYNVEKYIKECMESVLGQKTKYKIIVVLVDDGSTDETAAIADSYAGDGRVKVIHQKNKGFSGARNTALENIMAKYISFVDSDDMMCDGSIDALMNAAYETDADIAQGGYCNLIGSDIIKQPNVNEITDADGKNALRGQPWSKVYRSNLFEGLKFPEGFWFEDSINSFLIFPTVKKAVLIPDYVYIYRIQPESITRTAPLKPKCVDTFWITETLIGERRELGLDEDFAFCEKMLNQIILNCKRVSKMPQEVQQSVFVLTCEAADEIFKQNMGKSAHEPLLRALRSRDYGAYKLYCKTH